MARRLRPLTPTARRRPRYAIERRRPLDFEVEESSEEAAGIFGCIRDGYFSVTGIDLSDHVREFSVSLAIAELAANCHGDYVAKVIGGNGDWEVSVTFLQDFAASQVDEILSGIGVASQTGSLIEIGARKTGDVSATNPRYHGVAILTKYTPLSGAHGTNLHAKAVFRARMSRRTA